MVLSRHENAFRFERSISGSIKEKEKRKKPTVNMMTMKRHAEEREEAGVEETETAAVETVTEERGGEVRFFTIELEWLTWISVYLISGGNTVFWSNAMTSTPRS